MHSPVNAREVHYGDVGCHNHMVARIVHRPHLPFFKSDSTCSMFSAHIILDRTAGMKQLLCLRLPRTAMERTPQCTSFWGELPWSRPFTWPMLQSLTTRRCGQHSKVVWLMLLFWTIGRHLTSWSILFLWAIQCMASVPAPVGVCDQFVIIRDS